MESSIGLRQGSCEGPILFFFIMQAAIETLTWPVAKPVFHTRSKSVTMGERLFRKRDASSFDLWASLFADDCVSPPPPVPPLPAPPVPPPPSRPLTSRPRSSLTWAPFVKIWDLSGGCKKVS